MDTLLLIAVTAAGLVVYLAFVALFPWTACNHCEGAGRHRSPSGKNWRPCRRCKGSGRKERLGVQILRATGLAREK